MRRKELQKRAFKYINAEKSKQQTYEELKEMGGISQIAVANPVRNCPTVQSRQQYRNLILVFIFCLGLLILQMLYRGVTVIIENGFQWIDLGLLIRIGIHGILLWGVATFNGRSYKYMAIWLTISLVLLAVNGIADSFTLSILLYIIFVGAGTFLGFYLYFKLCPKYLVSWEEFQNPQGKNEMRKVITFED